jgi:hypothetical protein
MWLQLMCCALARRIRCPLILRERLERQSGQKIVDKGLI